ncbi:MAG: hypothetical protein RIF32_00280 [Leptospirales bacterium]|jgi:hypothetical protein
MQSKLVAALSRPIGRERFLKYAVKIFALTSVTVNAARCGSPGAAALPSAALEGISLQEYRNFNALAEVFLADLPFEFDAGLAVDRYVYGHPHPIENRSMVHELIGIPSSRLISVLLDGSFRTLVELNLEQRAERLHIWRDSGSTMKRGLYNIMRQTCFFIVSMRPEFAAYAGYDLNRSIVPYAGARA